MDKNIEKIKKNWQNKKILILGFAKEGRDTLKFLRKIFPEKFIAIADKKNFSKEFEKNKKIKIYFGKDYLRFIKNYDLIIKSPGIPIHLPEIEESYKKNKITSQSEIFIKNCPGKIIGVTGTKGKGTTCLIINAILKKSGIKTKLIGNIGKPVLNYLFLNKADEYIYIYELSSHQLYNLKNSPDIAVFLNLFEDHLDYFKNFKEYLSAKKNITLFQKKNDYLVYNFKDKEIKKIAQKSKAKKIAFSFDFKSKLLKEIQAKTLLAFQHNIAPAIALAKIFKVSDKNIVQAIEKIKPFAHRIEMVGTFKKITFYNDSAATIPEATIATIGLLKDRLETIILGGSEKNITFESLAKKILETKIKNIILFLPTGIKIYHSIVRQNKKKKNLNIFFVKNMKEAVNLSYRHSSKEKICLLSPASASFGTFRDYKHRGELFKKLVKK